jgi:ABC-type Na+ efflux pump permease subunit
LFTVIALTCWLSTTEWNRPSSYLDISRLSPLIFQVFTTVQLVILVFFAALAAASAVALEKDRRTFLLLLITDLSDKEIVLGKILGSLLPLMQLPLAVLPLQLLLVAAGGVGLEQVLIATAITWSRPLLKQRGPLHHPGTWWRKQQRQHWPPLHQYLYARKRAHTHTHNNLSLYIYIYIYIYIYMYYV